MKTPTPGPVSVLKLLEPSHFPWGASVASAFPVKEHVAQIFITTFAVTETQVSEVMEAAAAGRASASAEGTWCEET